MKIMYMLKKQFDAIAVLLMSVLAGACMGSAFDLFLITSNKSSFRFPFRVPFDKFFIYFGFLSVVIIFLAYLAFLVTRKDIRILGKVLHFLFIVIVTSVLAIVFAMLWFDLIELIHDFKRMIGMSRP